MTTSAALDVPMDESAPRRGSTFSVHSVQSVHSSISSVEGTGAWKKRKREDDVIDDYRHAFVGVRTSLEQLLLKDKAKLSRATIGSVLDHFSKVETIFMDAFVENVTLKTQIKEIRSLNQPSAQTNSNRPHTNLPPLKYSTILRSKDPKALIEPYCAPRPGVSSEATLARSTSPFKSLMPPSKRNVLILKPKPGDNRSADQVKADLLTKVRPQCPGVKITQFRKLQNRHK